MSENKLEELKKKETKTASFAIHITVRENDYFKLFLTGKDNRYFLQNALIESFSLLAKKIETEIFIKTERIPEIKGDSIKCFLSWDE